MSTENIYNVFYYKRKLLVVLTVLFLFFAVLLGVLLSYSLITIEVAGSEEKTVELKRDGATIHRFDTTEDSKTFIVRSGSYTIDANGSNMSSSYAVNLRGASITKSKVRLEPQKRLNLLGQDPSDCSIKQEVVVFYSCDAYSGMVYRSTNGSRDPAFNPVGLWAESEAAPHTAGIYNVIKPYQDGFLSFVSRDEALFITKRNSQGEAISDSTVKIDGFDSELKPYHVATEASLASDKFVVLDIEKMGLLVFDKHEESHKSIDVSDKIERVTNRQLNVGISEESAFIFIKQDPEIIESHGQDGEDINQFEAAQKIDQKIFVIDATSGETKKGISVGNDLIRQFEVNKNGDALLLATFHEDRENIQLVQKDGKKRDVLTPFGDVNNICWQDKENFYYSTLSANRIYRYNLAEQASFLMYSNAQGVIRNMNCFSGDLYVTLNNDRSGTGDLFHYVLSDVTHSGARVENILPLYVNIGADTLKVTLQGTSILIEQTLDGDNNPNTPDKNKARNEVVSRLEQRSVDTSDLEFVFGY